MNFSASCFVIIFIIVSLSRDSTETMSREYLCILTLNINHKKLINHNDDIFQMIILYLLLRSNITQVRAKLQKTKIITSEV